MQTRGVSEEQVEKVVRLPDRIGQAKRQNAKRLEKRLSKRRRLIVIVDEESTFIRVVTAYYQ